MAISFVFYKYRDTYVNGFDQDCSISKQLNNGDIIVFQQYMQYILVSLLKSVMMTWIQNTYTP